MDWQQDTKKHIELVGEFLCRVVEELIKRAVRHDITKLQEPEAAYFKEFTPKLQNSTYNSPEYKQFLKDMKPALDHHYKTYSHHPEHFENGVDDMSLIDLIEMICDWKAASLRHEDGDVLESIEKNISRFKLSPQLVSILKNTANDLLDFDDV